MPGTWSAGPSRPRGYVPSAHEEASPTSASQGDAGYRSIDKADKETGQSRSLLSA
ncbi:hypothetical protein GCM10010339_81450 [Streptomyces alanosinicus]|uniref:Uncharacterized protein n=1 Tax=Streptomyces alanosinicus TaxID=68171 RepID=A0A919D7S9_9ACTN|nr:hypothetical protein GCM10010339_81450 [Streptomyces alanosinicus]